MRDPGSARECVREIQPVAVAPALNAPVKDVGYSGTSFKRNDSDKNKAFLKEQPFPSASAKARKAQFRVGFKVFAAGLSGG